MASPWPKSVLVRTGTPVDIFAADGIDDSIDLLVIQNQSTQPVLTGEREAAPIMSTRGFRNPTDLIAVLKRPQGANDKQWLWVTSSAARVVYAPYVEPTP